MSAIVKEALRMIADPYLAGRSWSEVEDQQDLDPDEFADGEKFRAVMYTGWIYSNLAALILKGDEAALRDFIELADPQRLVRDSFSQPQTGDDA